MGIFRAKTLEKIENPEQLDDYIRLVNVPAWMALGAIALVVLVVVVWAVIGDVDGVSALQLFFS